MMKTTSRVLIAEDEPNLRKTLADILKANGYAVEEAASGAEAFKRLEREPVDVALIDLKLEDMSGMAILRNIKAHHEETECILITGYASKESAIEAVNLGAYGYVQKPYDMDQLLMTIRRAAEKRETEAALRESEEFKDRIIESSNDCISILDLEGNLLFMSRSGQNQMEIDDLAPYLHASWVDFWQESDDRRAAREAISKAGREGTGTFQAQASTPMGARKWWDHVITPVRDADGKVIQLLSVSRDISEQRRLEDQLRQSQKMEAVGTLVGGISHDFNNLLTSIIGNTSLALSELEEGHELYEMIKDVELAGEKAAALTRQLLTFTRKQVTQPEILDLNGVLKEIEKMLKRVLGEDIAFFPDMEAGLWSIYADPSQMDQVIMNLMVNARDAMPQGGKIFIKTANINLDRSFFRYPGEEQQPGLYVMLEVRDTGIGMDRKTLFRIFEPFYTSKDRSRHSGLGLSTLYGIIQQHNGVIRVESEPGKGSTFRVYLPKMREESGSEEKEVIMPDRLEGTETVLLVEDDDSLRRMVRRTLRGYGYRVLEAPDASDALKAAGEYKGDIHALITDVVMPGMGGPDLAARLRSSLPDLKVIFMSGYTDNRLTRHGFSDSDVNFVAKPFSPDDLAQKLRQVLDQ